MEEFSRDKTHLLSKLLIFQSVQNTLLENTKLTDKISSNDAEEDFDAFFKKSFNYNGFGESVNEEVDDFLVLCNNNSLENGQEVLSTSTRSCKSKHQNISFRNENTSLSLNDFQNEFEKTKPGRESFFKKQKEEFCNHSSKSTDRNSYCSLSFKDQEDISSQNASLCEKPDLGLKEKLDEFEIPEIDNFFD